MGRGDWLIIEADESDGSIVQYKPEIGLLLNIDKDHQETDELLRIFGMFRENTKDVFIVNQGNVLSRQLSTSLVNDFSSEPALGAGYTATNFKQEGMDIRFLINGHPFTLHSIGRHNMENAAAAIAVAHALGVCLLYTSRCV